MPYEPRHASPPGTPRPPASRWDREGWADVAAMGLGGLVMAGLLAGLLWAVAGVGQESVASWRAAHGEGRAGTFFAAREECSGGGGCLFVGEFTSDDGTVRLPDAVFGEPLPDLRAGGHARARFVGGGEARVFRERGSITWHVPVLVAALALACTAWWFARRSAVRAWQRRGRPRA